MTDKVIRTRLDFDLLDLARKNYCLPTYHTVYNSDMGCSFFAGCLEITVGNPPEKSLILLNGAFFSPREAENHAEEVLAKLKRSDDFDLTLILLDSQEES